MKNPEAGARAGSRSGFILILVACAVGLGVAYLPRKTEAPVERLPQTVVLPRPSPAAQTSEVFKELLAAFREAPPGSDRVGNLLAVLRAHKDDPAARDFIAEFNANPELRALWKGGAQDDGDSEPLASRVRRLSESKAFLDLLNKRSQDTGFRALAAAVTQELRARNAKPADSLGLIVKEDSRKAPPAATARKFAAARLADGGPARSSGDLRPQAQPGLAAPGPAKGFAAAAASTSSNPPPPDSQLDQGSRQKILDQLVRQLGTACGQAGSALDCAQAQRICRTNEDCRGALERARGGSSSSAARSPGTSANTAPPETKPSPSTNNSGDTGSTNIPTKGKVKTPFGKVNVCITLFGPVPCP